MKSICFLILLQLGYLTGWSQISPGDLAQAHAHLEGMSNCTKCHTLGSKISNEKCLDCHKEIKSRVDQKKGYHSSSMVYKKSCTICHSDHHGRQYQIIRFDKNKFDHKTTGYILEGKHASAQCGDCHKPANISDPVLKKKKVTYLGLDGECLTCHEDQHQKTLSSKCNECHTFDGFKPATRFDHARSAFKLKGKHREVECIKCHEKTMVNGKEFQKFKGIKSNSCSNCHKDVHNNSFGQKCSDCHVEESFKVIKRLSSFDHNLTNFKLEGRHIAVECSKCHKGSYTNPVKHSKCSDCHTDYHKGDFVKNGVMDDCKSCHDVNGFSPSNFTTERHNESAFRLEGAHMATPCIACHKKTNEWRFRKIGAKCNDCHTDIHKENLDPKYYPEANCLSCHSVESWRNIVFDHNVTKFPLQGKHKEQSCRSCHDMAQNGNINAGSNSQSQEKAGTASTKQSGTASGAGLKFTGLPSQCMECHDDQHAGQFNSNGVTDCKSCHSPEAWIASTFDHNNARFKLDGRHRDIACIKCHPVVEDPIKPYVLYKTGKIKCADCH